METFTSNNTSPVNAKKPVVQKKSIVFSMGRVMICFAIGILITGLVAFFYPDILIATCGSNTDLLAVVYVWSMIVSAVVLLISSVFIFIKSFNKNSPMVKVFYILYTLAMGVLLSSILLTIFSIDEQKFFSTVAIAFFATAGCFLVMGIISMFIKNGSILWPLIITFLIGSLVMSLVNGLVLHSELVYWIIDFVVFAVMLIMIGFDIKNVKALADANAFTSENNLAVYCAYVLYSDFIYVFIKILYYVAIARSRNQ